MRDRVELNQEAGVRAYWIVTPHNRHVLPFVLNERNLRAFAPRSEKDEVLTSAIFPGLFINEKVLFKS